MGTVYIAKDLGVNIKIDAKATMGTLHQQGSSRLKHPNTNALRLHKKGAGSEVTLEEIRRVYNMADMMTHALPWSEVLKHVIAMEVVTRERKLDPKSVERQ